jgi:hypothetical protein
MTDHRRRSTRATIRLETLEVRLAPVPINPSHTHMVAIGDAALVHAKGHHQRPDGSTGGLHRSSRLASNPRLEHAHPKAHPKIKPIYSGSRSAQPTAPLPADASQQLQVIYQEFEAAGAQGSFSSLYRGIIEIDGSSVGVMIKGDGGDFETLVSDLEQLGLQVNAEDATTQTVSGLLPIGALPQAAENPLTLSVTPVFLPHLLMR